MRRYLASLANDFGFRLINSGKSELGTRFYGLAASIDSNWSVPYYNLGLQYKNVGRWEKSLKYNQRALELNPGEEATTWNLGIAATALNNWPEARRAWRAYGIELENEEGDVRMRTVKACVRLNPNKNGEVVWGRRIDPARIVILNVPLPESAHRFHDIILNDGASEGTRVDASGNEVPVFNELSTWKVSEYSTFSVRLHVPDESAEEVLNDLCVAKDLGLEDWSTIRFLCGACSKGNPAPHRCEAKPLDGGLRRFGFGSKSKEDLLAVLQEWSSTVSGVDFEEPQIQLDARPV